MAEVEAQGATRLLTAKWRAEFERRKKLHNQVGERSCTTRWVREAVWMLSLCPSWCDDTQWPSPRCLSSRGASECSAV